MTYRQEECAYDADELELLDFVQSRRLFVRTQTEQVDINTRLKVRRLDTSPLHPVLPYKLKGSIQWFNAPNNHRCISTAYLHYLAKHLCHTLWERMRLQRLPSISYRAMMLRWEWWWLC